MDWNKLSIDPEVFDEVVELLKERESIEEKIMSLDDSALILYEIARL